MVIVGGASGGSPFFFFGSGLSRLGPGVMASKGGGPYISEGTRGNHAWEKNAGRDAGATEAG
jgi:hypothetical protein